VGKVESVYRPYLSLQRELGITKVPLPLPLFSERLSASNRLSTSGSVSKVWKYLSILASKEASRRAIESFAFIVFAIDKQKFTMALG
jgi:hypothetical protein